MAEDPGMTGDGALRVNRQAKTLRELALEKLRQAILRFRFRPGERLVERDLCELLGVSRSVVREALRHLEAEGLVETIPHQGPIVARFDPATVEQIYEIRALLEGMAARTCAETANPETADRLAEAIDGIKSAFDGGDPPEILDATTTFYSILFAEAGKTEAWKIVNSLNARVNHLRAVTIGSENRGEVAPQEMHRIVDAIRKGDADDAHEAAVDHIRVASRIAMTHLTENPEPEERRRPR